MLAGNPEINDEILCRFEKKGRGFNAFEKRSEELFANYKLNKM